jgi:hypothetical protein
MARDREYREVIYGGDAEYKEEFKGDILVFQPGERKVMERRDAVHFLAQYKPFDREKSTGDKPFSWRPAPPGAKPSVQVAAVVEDTPEFVNHATGAKLASKDDLDKDLEGFQHLKLKEDEPRKK